MYRLLFIQDICLSWDKKERGSACAQMRAKFPMAYSFDQLPDTLYGDVMIHRLYFRQKGTTFQTCPMYDAGRFQFYASVRDLNLTNLSVRWDTGCYEVTFFYDERRSGEPVRRGHNKAYHTVDSRLYRHDILNETAFSLEPGQYGRVLWNERKRDYDTGEWYYQWHAIHFLHLCGKMPQMNCFLDCKPDYEYEQMAVLY